ncbi:MAG: hypothetical protein PWP07_2697 [Epulopiscium sp.]|nr:hypothetical protein [Candidatus Epulonipiscium sp.]MDK2920426.1 hypothetical protein [Candidatus Petromonas sp.]
MRIPYDQELIKKIKTISERKWNPEGKYREVSDDVMPLQTEGTFHKEIFQKNN